ncbi:MAG: hypothetical protein LUG93_00660 [Lachnospiraceae bacterium]|nr:hypothetical protein [Lachnospiraceae bacterium]
MSALYRSNAKEIDYEEVTVLDKPMLFTCLRVDRATVPKGMYCYEVRHDDEGRGDPCEIANWVMVNHWGTLISNQPIALKKNAASSNAYREIEPEKDWNYEGVDSTLQEYMEKHPPKKERNRGDAR